MNHWWQSLTLKKQRLIALIGIIAVIGLFWLAVWHPLNSQLSQKQQELAGYQQVFNYIQQNNSQLIATQKVNIKSVDYETNMLKAINTLASKSGIKLSRVQPKGDMVQVWMDQIKFAQLVTWLQQLQQNYAITPTYITIEKHVSGIVIVQRLQLERT